MAAERDHQALAGGAAELQRAVAHGQGQRIPVEFVQGDGEIGLRLGQHGRGPAGVAALARKAAEGLAVVLVGDPLRLFDHALGRLVGQHPGQVLPVLAIPVPPVEPDPPRP